jgi:hypothetical protein
MRGFFAMSFDPHGISARCEPGRRVLQSTALRPLVRSIARPAGEYIMSESNPPASNGAPKDANDANDMLVPRDIRTGSAGVATCPKCKKLRRFDEVERLPEYTVDMLGNVIVGLAVWFERMIGSRDRIWIGQECAHEFSVSSLPDLKLVAGK